MKAKVWNSAFRSFVASVAAMYVDLFVICMPVAWSHIFFFFSGLGGRGHSAMLYVCLCMHLYARLYTCQTEISGGGNYGLP